ncbi:hypothetical protein XU18_0979 [Perkinsela sp. CCAP 1560/4]|nr:hypothetical protein XU18_0979 [Perkinsela sp. CCAP 1560/4]|eukprot:KNH08506.1 hypothetical protein XU18_0979 [Perkinsela sp. CCAP 1560/4]
MLSIALLHTQDSSWITWRSTHTLLRMAVSVSFHVYSGCHQPLVTRGLYIDPYVVQHASHCGSRKPCDTVRLEECIWRRVWIVERFGIHSKGEPFTKYPRPMNPFVVHSIGRRNETHEHVQTGRPTRSHVLMKTSCVAGIYSMRGAMEMVHQWKAFAMPLLASVTPSRDVCVIWIVGPSDASFRSNPMPNAIALYAAFSAETIAHPTIVSVLSVPRALRLFQCHRMAHIEGKYADAEWMSRSCRFVRVPGKRLPMQRYKIGQYDGMYLKTLS